MRVSKRKATRWAPLMSTLALACAGGSADRDEGLDIWFAGARIDGVNLVAAPYPLDHASLAPVVSAGAEWVAVVPYAFVPRAGGAPVFDRSRQFEGETLSGVGSTVALARAHGLHVLMKPHLWISGEGWAGEHLPHGEERVAFERGYAEYVLAFARLADSLGVEMLSVGTEVDRHALARPGFWRGLIRRVRAEFSGELTYAANWDAYGDIEFWDELDYIGIDAYFPLVDGAAPEPAQLRSAWGPWVAEVRSLAGRVRRPVLFTEFGYRNVSGGAWRQWELPTGREAAALPRNDALQAAAYEALFEVWWTRPWFAGGFLWKWHTPPADRGSATSDDRWRIGSGSDDGYTPQGKLALEVVRRWYAAP